MLVQKVCGESQFSSVATIAYDWCRLFSELELKFNSFHYPLTRRGRRTLQPFPSSIHLPGLSPFATSHPYSPMVSASCRIGDQQLRWLYSLVGMCISWVYHSGKMMKGAPPARQNSTFPSGEPPLRMHSKELTETRIEATNVYVSPNYVTQQQKSQHGSGGFGSGFKLWGWSLFSIIPWAIASNIKMERPTTINRKLKRRTQYAQVVEGGGAGGIRGNPLRFRPYVSKVPWHTGPRAFLSQLFPRYGHYCGPNWSSGKDQGSLLWDKRPIDWLDYCCYCHDMGYDTHDQAELLKADLKFLDCLERPNMVNRGDSHVAHIYRTMSIAGLKNILVPYRTHLVKLQSGVPLINFGWLSNVNFRGWKFSRIQGSQQ
ncbi:unnamed protein product [Linum tenue]|uniref:Phospholipase A(2) n=1 Tax=Linum tenue TaxID=586396 RepID=A0AAV0Q8M2_9ROSI|nr:unnamed protein product [Linum tenue]